MAHQYRKSNQGGWTIQQTMRVVCVTYPEWTNGITLANFHEQASNALYAARDNAKPKAEARWKERYGFAYTSQKAIFAEFLFQTGGTSKQHVTLAARAIRQHINNATTWGPYTGNHPFWLTKNNSYTNSREPIPKGDELDQKIRNTFSAVKAAVDSELRESRKDPKSAPTQQPTRESKPTTQQTTYHVEVDTTPDEPVSNYDTDDIDENSDSVEPTPVILVVDESVIRREKAEDLLMRIDNGRAMTVDLRDPITGLSFDNVGFRWYLPAAELFAAGMDTDIIFANLIRNWPAERKAEIWSADGGNFRNGKYVPKNRASERMPWDYDATQFVPDQNLPGIKYIDENDHKAIGLVMTYLNVLRLAWLIGPPGTGKTHMVEGCAKNFGKAMSKKFPFVVISLSRATPLSAFNGKQKIDGTSQMIQYLHAQAEGDVKLATKLAKEAEEAGDTTMSLFEKACREGGIIGLDEADRADPNTIGVLNAPLAQRRFVNTVSQRECELHPDTMFMMMTNTEGIGANRAHNTAEKLDDALIDRFRAARCYVDLDKDLAERKFWETVEASL